MSVHRIRTALFVDFDNIYISLEKNQPEAAQLFARYPQKWLAWLERDGPRTYREYDGGTSVRRILVRRCYINPRPFSQYRSFFIRSGFEVVDCPALTAQGKTSADIHMVIDILDTLGDSTPIDEFMILSADADFTPALLRLRRRDRRTCILAFGSVSTAYTAAADQVLDEQAFLENGLGLTEPSATPAPKAEKRTRPPKALLKKIGGRLLQEVELQNTLSADKLPALFKEFEEFRAGTDWLGYLSMRTMAEAVVGAVSGLEIDEEDPWQVRRKEESGEMAAPESSDRSKKMARMTLLVRKVVDESDRPVSLSALANRTDQDLGPEYRSSRWLGFGSFLKLLEGLELGNLRLSLEPPAAVYDPARHGKPKGPGERDLPEVVRRVCQVTDVPLLSTREYSVVFRQIAKEINRNGYSLSRTSRNVRDGCHGKEVPVARAHISFVLKGLAFCDHDFQKKQEPWEVAHSFVREVFLLCERSQVDLKSDEEEVVQKWITDGIFEDLRQPAIPPADLQPQRTTEADHA